MKPFNQKTDFHQPFEDHLSGFKVPDAANHLLNAAYTELESAKADFDVAEANLAAAIESLKQVGGIDHPP